DGDVVVQGEDLGRWVTAQRFGWEQLLPVQQWILENTLKIRPAEKDERPVKRTQDTMWVLNLTAARQFHAREGHLRVPRKHAEHLETEDALSGRQGGTEGPVVVRLGTWLDNVRKRATKLPEQRSPRRPSASCRQHGTGQPFDSAFTAASQANLCGSAAAENTA
ncbi:helicase associated domain-containing protein, partial [Streptomyces sp. NPDC056921]|uniref:helicase associated domain-containing protein n=1 Tax=Streptomyces sp. NPDC056921 TaxID=3345966 RepID=UPI00364528F6